MRMGQQVCGGAVVIVEELERSALEPLGGGVPDLEDNACRAWACANGEPASEKIIDEARGVSDRLGNQNVVIILQDIGLVNGDGRDLVLWNVDAIADH